jgi:hypothetical protein
MRKTLAFALTLTLISSGLAFAEEDAVIKDAMKFAHKAPKGEKKLSDKILDGSASEEDVKKALDLYKKMADAKPPRGEQADFKKKVAKVVEATEELVKKDPQGVAHYKAAIDCKACHSEHKPQPPAPAK